MMLLETSTGDTYHCTGKQYHSIGTNIILETMMETNIVWYWRGIHWSRPIYLEVSEISFNTVVSAQGLSQDIRTYTLLPIVIIGS